jgi:hypothetical protein
MWKCENVMNVGITATALSSFHLPSARMNCPDGHFHVYTFITFITFSS